MSAIQIIKKLAKTNSRASQLWKESFEPHLSLIFNRPIFNPVVISNFCEENNLELTESEKNILFI